MLLKTINSPIVIFNIDDLGVNQKIFLEETKNIFSELPWDYYDMRKMQLDYLTKHLPTATLNTLSQNLLIDYYQGKIDASHLQFLLKQLPQLQREQFEQIKPYRKRSIAEFILTFTNNWSISRFPANQFSQVEAKIDEAGKLDYRQFPRIFSESTHEAVETDIFTQLLIGIANTVRKNHENVKKLNIVTHHTHVQATQDQVGDNSPEGIHQDGFDYIVSALVIERKNITGGVSQVFGSDKKTCFLKTQLMPGQGILQPDKDTCLWHSVTPFAVLPECKTGYRSSIGFDINLMQ